MVLRDILISAIRFLRMGFSVSNLDSRGGIWTPLESTVAIICASAVALRPFLAGTILRFLSARRHGRCRTRPNDDKPGRNTAVENSYMDEKELPRLPTPDEEEEIGMRLPDRSTVEGDALMGWGGEVRTSLLSIGTEDEGIPTKWRESEDKEMRTRPRASTLMKVGASLPNGGKVTDSTFLTSTPINLNEPKRRDRASTLMRIGVVLPRGGKVTDSTFLTTTSATEKEMGNRTRSSTLVRVGMVLDEVV